MCKAKSPIDDFFFEIYGYYPTKSGKAYELLVGAALKIVTGKDAAYDQFRRGDFSDTVYQLDGVLSEADSEEAVEAKDYTIDQRPVGRGDLQKLQGALSDLPIQKGIIASATEYTQPAKKYSTGSAINPAQKHIDLFHVRLSTVDDEKGRVKTISIIITIVEPSFSQGKFTCHLTQAANELVRKANFLSQGSIIKLNRFYNPDGSVFCTMEEFSRANQPIQVSMQDSIGEGCWVLNGLCVKYGDQLLGMRGIEYAIPFTHTSETVTIESQGEARVLVKSEDGKVNKLLTDKQFQALTFNNGSIEHEQSREG